MYLEDELDSESVVPRVIAFKEEQVMIPLVLVSSETSFVAPPDNPMQLVIEDVEPIKAIEEITIRKSQRARRPTISNDYLVYLQEHEYDVVDDNDPTNFSQALSSPNSVEWIDAMKDELASTHRNEVWDLLELLVDWMPCSCKWVFKTKRDA